MRLSRHKRFSKQFIKLSQKEKIKLEERLSMFVKEPYSVELNNHALHGKCEGFRSINIYGNLRALYRVLNDTDIIFIWIDDHGGLYD